MIHDLSLIIPAYNVEDYIAATLSSVYSQVTRVRVQCIVIDDASSDKSRSIIIDAKNLFPENITLKLIVNQSNKGVAFARNLGVLHAEAPYIIFLDADDLLMPGAIDYLHGVAKSANADIVDTDFIEFRKTEELNISFNQEVNTLEIDDPLHRSLIIRGFPWGKIYRRALFEGVMYPPGLIVEDIITLPQLILRSRCVIKSNQITFAYRKRLGSLSGKESAVKNKYAQHMLGGLEYLLSCEKSRDCGFSPAFNEQFWNEMTIVFRSRSFYCSYSEMKQHLRELSVLLEKWISYSPSVQSFLNASFLNRCIQWSIRRQGVLVYRIAARIKKYNYQQNRSALLRHYGFKS